MNNNVTLRRLRDTFSYNDSKMISIFDLADHKVTSEQICDWLKTEEDPAYQACSDIQLTMFLNGMINDMRGKQEGPTIVPDKRLNNNIVLVKLKIALNLQAEDILKILDLVDVQISKHELSAFFRKPGNTHYRACKDEILYNFLKGVQHQYRENH